MSNICHCPNPPGGQVVCESHQIAICRVKNGIIESYCLNPTRALIVGMQNRTRSLRGRIQKSNNIIINQLLFDLTKDKRFLNSPLPIMDTLDILINGLYENLDTGEEISFKMPSWLVRRLNSVKKRHLIRNKRLSKRIIRGSRKD